MKEWKKGTKGYLREVVTDVNNIMVNLKNMLSTFDEPQAFLMAMGGINPETDAGEVIIANIIENISDNYDIDGGLEVIFDEDDEEEEIDPRLRVPVKSDPKDADIELDDD